MSTYMTSLLAVGPLSLACDSDMGKEGHKPSRNNRGARSGEVDLWSNQRFLLLSTSVDATIQMGREKRRGRGNVKVERRITLNYTQIERNK